jgi:glucose dehydrogenase
MSCALTSGYSLDCKDSSGGIVEVYFIEKANVTSMTTTSSGVITALTKATGKRFWKYELPKETGSLTETINGNVQNGTVFYSSELKIVVNKLNPSVRTEILLLAQNTLIAVAKDNNGFFWLLGRANGVDLSTGTLASGTAFGDRSGFDLTFTGSEPEPMYALSNAVSSVLETAG